METIEQRLQKLEQRLSILEERNSVIVDVIDYEDGSYSYKDESGTIYLVKNNEKLTQGDQKHVDDFVKSKLTIDNKNSIIK